MQSATVIAEITIPVAKSTNANAESTNANAKSTNANAEIINANAKSTNAIAKSINVIASGIIVQHIDKINQPLTAISPNNPPHPFYASLLLSVLATFFFIGIGWLITKR